MFKSMSNALLVRFRGTLVEYILLNGEACVLELKLSICVMCKHKCDGSRVKDVCMGCRIDGFLAVVAHSHILQEGPVTGRTADVIAAANTAAEVALRLVRPGKKVCCISSFAFIC
ncbi:ERBB-3 BINDING PROTEIN 1 [Abeliophyllum distichum]|uniref:ERBB-3 BINDING PROTEIN 1 n=1 Tax=Abeliophyllum distichum TaxID=126358 RepID=A0ABD1QFU1_9LAMI